MSGNTQIITQLFKRNKLKIALKSNGSVFDKMERII